MKLYLSLAVILQFNDSKRWKSLPTYEFFPARLQATSLCQECSGAAMAASRKRRCMALFSRQVNFRCNSPAQVHQASDDQIISNHHVLCKKIQDALWETIWYCGSITCFGLPIALQPTLPSIGHSIAPANLGQPGPKGLV